MTTFTRRAGVAAAASILSLLAFAGPALADDGHGGTANCNSGRGNGSETLPDNDCDPGNSGANNNGGD